MYACAVADHLKGMETLIEKWLGLQLENISSDSVDHLNLARRKFLGCLKSPVSKEICDNSKLREDWKIVNRIMDWDWSELNKSKIPLGIWLMLLRTYEKRRAFGTVNQLLSIIKKESNLSHSSVNQQSRLQYFEKSNMYVDSHILNDDEVLSIAYHATFLALANNGQVYAAMSLIQEMTNSGISLQPSGLTGLIKLYGYCPPALSLIEKSKDAVRKKASLKTLKPVIETGITSLVVNTPLRDQFLMYQLVYRIGKEYYFALRQFDLNETAYDFARYLNSLPQNGKHIKFNFIHKD
jgi:hypothetical protein